jgi:cytoskeletal protein CcmA (bactofilin family)
MIKKIGVVVLGMMLMMPLVVSAVSFASGPNYSLTTSETIDGNFYSAGGTMSITGDVIGDAMVAGGNVFVSGSVADDLSVAGGTLNILGSVGEDLRVVGGNVLIGGSVAGESVAVGGQVQLVPGAVVEKDALFAGGYVVLDGTLRSDVRVWADEVVVNGMIEGDVQIKAKTKVTIGDNAVLHGTLQYYAPQEAEVADGAQLSAVEYNVWSPGKIHAPEVSVGGLLALFSVWWIAKVIMMIVVGLLLLWLFTSMMEQVVHEGMKMFGKEFLRGFIVAVIVPVAIVLLCITVIGMLLGGIGIALYVLLMMLASVTGTILFGSWVVKFFAKEEKYEADWRAVVTGAVVLGLVQLVPVVGWIVGCIFMLAGLGVFSRIALQRMRAVK